MTVVFEVTPEGRAEALKRRKRKPDDDGGTPLHAAAEAAHEAQKSGGPLASAIAVHCVAPAPEHQITIGTGQGGDHPEASVSRPGSVLVQHMDLNASRFVPAKPFAVSTVPVQRPFHTAPIAPGSAA